VNLNILITKTHTYNTVAISWRIVVRNLCKLGHEFTLSSTSKSNSLKLSTCAHFHQLLYFRCNFLQTFFHFVSNIIVCPSNTKTYYNNITKNPPIYITEWAWNQRVLLTILNNIKIPNLETKYST